MFSKKIIFFFLIFFILSLQLEAKIVSRQPDTCFDKIAGNNNEFIKNKKTFINLYNLFLNNDITSIQLFSKNIIGKSKLPKYIVYYFSALSNYYLGLLSIDTNEDKALIYFDKAKDLIADSLKYNTKFHESLRLAGDIYGLLLSIKPLMSPFYGPISDSYSSKSYLVNPNNPLLDISFGDGFYHTPFLFGGDEDKAKEMFEKAYSSCPLLEDTSYRLLWYDVQEDDINKKTCDIFTKHKNLIKIKVFKSTLEKVKKQCSLMK